MWTDSRIAPASILGPLSLRLGHARALTRPRRVIHSPRAASLPKMLTDVSFGLGYVSDIQQTPFVRCRGGVSPPARKMNAYAKREAERLPYK